MITKSFVIRPSLLLMSAGVLLIASGDRCLSQDAKQKENQDRQMQILLGADGLDIVSPAIKKQILEKQILEPPEQRMLPPGTESLSELYSPDNPGIGRRNMNPLRIQSGNRSNPKTRYHPEAHSPEGAFAEDRRRIAALTESAERIAQAGLPDVAHGLRERAGQLERELAEKQERMQQEKRQRAEAEMRERQEQARQQPQPHQPQRLMEQRREGIERGDHPAPPLRKLHEQMEQLRREMHKLSEQMADLTRLIQQHHHPRNDRGHHDGDDEDGDDEDGDDEDGDDEDGDDEEEMGDDDFPDHKERGGMKEE